MDPSLDSNVLEKLPADDHSCVSCPSVGGMPLIALVSSSRREPEAPKKNGPCRPWPALMSGNALSRPSMRPLSHASSTRRSTSAPKSLPITTTSCSSRDNPIVFIRSSRSRKSIVWSVASNARRGSDDGVGLPDVLPVVLAERYRRVVTPTPLPENTSVLPAYFASSLPPPAARGHRRYSPSPFPSTASPTCSEHSAATYASSLGESAGPPPPEDAAAVSVHRRRNGPSD